MESSKLEILKQVAAGIVAEFGTPCEVRISDVNAKGDQQTVLHIENGHLTDCSVGDTLPLEGVTDAPHIVWLEDGRVTRVTTYLLRNQKGKPFGALTIQYDITGIMMLQHDVNELLDTHEQEEKAQESANITDVLDELIEQSVALIGKPVAMMNKDEKIRAIHFLDEHGAFLVTKSGGKVAKYFGISKYTLYSYIDANRPEKEEA